MADWNSTQYMKFEKERTQPSIDLLNRIELTNPRNILDIGCGPGNSTAVLYNKFPTAKVHGIDNSDDMLKRAAESYPDLKFSKCSVPDGVADIKESFDLIFSNACIHWIPNQEKLIKTVMDKLNVNGIFAVQIPLVQTAPFYQMLSDIVALEKWNDKLGHIKNFHNLMPEQYYDVLSEITDDLEIWQTTYYHTVQTFEGILEWYKGSGLRPYFDALNEADRVEFEKDILQRIKQIYPIQKDNNIILKMPRLFFIARKRRIIKPTD